MKKLGLLVLTAGISAIACFGASAGEWKQDNSGWWYDNGDATYQNSGWSWIDGTCYYFTPDGYCLMNTTTPDGYQVDASGAWNIDGVVQTQGTTDAGTYQGMQFTPPESFYFYDQIDYFTVYVSYDQQSMIGIYDVDLEVNVSELSEDAMAYAEETLDRLIGDLGAYSSKNHLQLASGNWTRYDLTNGNFLGIPGDMIVYTRIQGQHLYIMFFCGSLSDLDTNAVVSSSRI
ncbi:MAG: hypothetical protein ACRDBO_11165 [Lachnospiraceae bacterium]